MAKTQQAKLVKTLTGSHGVLFPNGFLAVNAPSGVLAHKASQKEQEDLAVTQGVAWVPVELYDAVSTVIVGERVLSRELTAFLEGDTANGSPPSTH